MFKSIILQKKRQVFENRKADAFEDAVCVDCKKQGHFTKDYFKCDFYKAPSADDVGSRKGKKRKQSFDVKNQKKKARMEANLNEDQNHTKVCSKCKQPGHSSASSPLCPDHIQRKSEVFKQNLGDHYQAFTRRIPFDNCVFDKYRDRLKENVIEASSAVRYLALKARIFVNCYILENSEYVAPKCIFAQNFWYTVIQMVNGQTPKKTSTLPKGFIDAYNSFKTNYPSFARSKTLLPGISQCISEACTELATSCLNKIVENFEQRLVNFLKFKLQMMFVSMHPSLVHDVVNRFCYQEICCGEPQWPTSDYLTGNIKQTITNYCQPWKKRLLVFFLVYKVQEKFSSLPSSLVREVVYLFCYQEIIGEEPSWPRSVHLTDKVKSQIIGFCQPWKQRKGERINLKTLSANPGCFVPFLFLINNELEKEHDAHIPYDVRRLPLPRLFSVLPTASIRWRFVTVSVNALSCFTKQKLPRGYQNQLECFYRVFKFKSLRYRNLLSLTPNGENTALFGNIIRTDGFSVDFLFYKRRHVSLEATYQTLDLSLDDFNQSEIEKTYVPIFVDPNRKSVFSATVGIEDPQIRKCSMKEYYHLTGSTRFTKDLEIRKASQGITLIESNIPSPKTSSLMKYRDYVSYMMSNVDTLFAFYGPSDGKDHFTLYQGKQRAIQLMINMLTHGTSKYNRKKRNRAKLKKKRRKRRKRNLTKTKELGTVNEKTRKWRPSCFSQPEFKVPLVVFGAGMFGKDNVKLKGLRCGVVGKFFQGLKRREAEGALIVVTIDEYNTSKKCSLCLSTLDDVKTKGYEGKSVLACKNCKTVWQRDVNASLNMMTISLSIWSGKGRPATFKYQKKRSP